MLNDLSTNIRINPNDDAKNNTLGHAANSTVWTDRFLDHVYNAYGTVVLNTTISAVCRPIDFNQT